MLTIKVWCLPNSSQEKLGQTHEEIVKTVCSVKQLALKGENDMMVLFPADSMAYGLGSVIVIEITGILENKDRSHSTLNKLASKVGKVVQKLFPEAKNVECSVSPFEPKKSGFWSSLEQEDIESVKLKDFFSTFSETSIRTRIKEILFFADIKTIGQLLSMSQEELLKFRNFGVRSLEELNCMLKERYGITLERSKK